MSIRKKSVDAFRLTRYRMMRYEKASQNKEMQASHWKLCGPNGTNSKF